MRLVFSSEVNYFEKQNFNPNFRDLTWYQNDILTILFDDFWAFLPPFEIFPKNISFGCGTSLQRLKQTSCN